MGAQAESQGGRSRGETREKKPESRRKEAGKKQGGHDPGPNGQNYSGATTVYMITDGNGRPGTVEGTGRMPSVIV